MRTHSSTVTSAGIELLFEGRPIPARPGETLAAALVAAGEHSLRDTRRGGARGVFCGMGVCQECLVEVDGRPNQRACMTKVTGPHQVRRQLFPGRAARRERGSEPPPDGEIRAESPEVLVIGGGAGGLSAAAAAAEAGAEVVLIDERPAPGGQYYKQPGDASWPSSDKQFAGGRALIERAARVGVRIIQGEVWGAFEPLDLAVLGPDGPGVFRPKRLIVAAGAYERGLPLPGWTLPGVMTTGAAQTLLRSYRVLPGRRVLVAGNGPLNLQVALELARAGAQIVAVAELAPPPGVEALGALGRMAASSPDLVADGVGYLVALRRRRIPLLYGTGLMGVEAIERGGLRARLGVLEAGSLRESRLVEADAVCMGYGFMPSNDAMRALGCRHDFDPARGHLVTNRSADCETSVQGVYGVGDCCGLGGARAAVDEGIIAGLAAAGALGREVPSALLLQREAARRRLPRHRAFQDALWRLYGAPRFQAELARPDTVLCRCEDVTLGEIDEALADGEPSIGEVKRRTRVGMGRCQGRYCAPVLASILAERQGRPLDERAFFAPRAPIKPVAIEDLVRTSSR